ncbi:hypothetical protein BD560DRAFT_428933 [Blakeslea trispora]|nr:hypothetical protein BD560DRAFT_428933 [Blakeslea trispora]
MAWVGSLLLLLVERLLVNLDSFFLGVFLQAMFLTSMVSATARTFFGISKTGSESVAEDTATYETYERKTEGNTKSPKSKVWILTVKKCRIPVRNLQILTVFFCQLTVQSCPYFDTVRHWSDTPRF